MEHQSRKDIGKVMMGVVCLHAFKHWLSILPVVGAVLFSLILGLRLGFDMTVPWAAVGVLFLLPLIVVMVIAFVNRPAQSAVRAFIDKSSNLHGLYMSEEEVALGPWQAHVKSPAIPKIKLPLVKTITHTALAALCLLFAMLVPLPDIKQGDEPPLEIASQVKTLNETLAVLEEEEILPEERVEVLEKQLNEVFDQSSGRDPIRTWEALDHMESLLAKALSEGMAEATASMEKTYEAEALANTMAENLAKGVSLSPKDAAALTKQLARMGEVSDFLQAQKMSAFEVSPELAKALSRGALSPKAMAELKKSLKNCRNGSCKSLKKLMKCSGKNPKGSGGSSKSAQAQNALLLYLSNSNGPPSLSEFQFMCSTPGAGGVSRGRGDAAMAWGKPVSRDGVKFKQERLDPSQTNPEQGALLGVSLTAPEVSEKVATTGALSGATSQGASGRTGAIHPRHRRAVQQYFNRREESDEQ